MQAKSLNPQATLEFLCSAGFGALLLYFIGSGKYLTYVTPRMLPYLCFAALVMLVWAFWGLRRMFRLQYKKRAAHCLVLAIPALLLLLPHAPMNYADLSVGYIGGNTLAQGKAVNTLGKEAQAAAALSSAPAAALVSSDIAAPETVPAAADTAGASASSDPYTQSDASGTENALNLTGLDEANKSIIITDEEYYPWLNEIFNNTDKYLGYQVSIKGFVFKEPENMSESEFVAARLMMSCCVADLAPCGIICQYDKAPELKPDTWLTVHGTICIGQYLGADQPQIAVTDVAPAEEVEGYIYPGVY